MSDIVFTCPSCGQPMQSPKAFLGDTTECPRCRAAVRIPFSYTPPEPDTQLPRGELVTAGQPAKAAATESHPSVADIVAYRREDAGKPASPGDSVVSCRCPVCHANLRVLLSVQLHTVQETPAPAPAENAPPAKPETPASPSSERERQIAAARAERDPRLYPAVKPRMSYILSGGERVAPNEPQPENPQPPGPAPPNPSDPQSFPE
ncbi:MAG TPA: hypothetical protein GYA07_10855 [Verrucomicrobia bacterium]|nr:hypothetical protein [Verrucomicrobiota bacterium]HOP99165.1 hypothetical protein [Verrucomicrobiota bacterium]